MSTLVNAVIFMTSIAGMGMACFRALCAFVAHWHGWYFKRDICLVAVFAGGATCGLMTALLVQRTGVSVAFWVLVVTEGVLVLATGATCWLYAAVKRESE